MLGYQARPRVTALLGPTNTGKTHLAIERMLDHATGMIGFPLRLLARENYDRVVRLKGARHVALVTGEEKIVPAGARYYLCTVESMPVEKPVEFLAIDEIQLAADRERGHAFTDRLLRARGLTETMFLGSDTIRGLIQILVPDAEFVTRPRFSRLSYSGPRKIGRLPPRSAMVAFSAAEVYGLAEFVRRHRGGAAVVLGALSPRTRNAQVGMYQAGEVDYLVATDAIGMGLNMDVDHVAFWRIAKFDGRANRRLSAAEVGQIAGRAGRYMTDGSFGTAAELGPLEPELVEAVENHRFDPVKTIYWRNQNLDYSNAQSLIASLVAPPPRPELIRKGDADDHAALLQLTRDPEIARLARSPAAVRMLWEVCKIPDFRKTMTEAHTRLLARIYGHLMAPTERLPTDWVARQLAQLDRIDGDIDTLMARIAHVRTWTFVSHRPDWLSDSQDWQERARAIEDRLSDALHDRLTQRFVDRRSAVLLRLKDKESVLAAVTEAGEVVVEGEFVGRLEGFRFHPDGTSMGDDRRALVSAAARALKGEIATRTRRLIDETDDAFAVDGQGRLTWHDVAIAHLVAGPSILQPRIEAMVSEFLTGEQRAAIEHCLQQWLEAFLERELEPIYGLDRASLSGPARGLAYQLIEALGSKPRREAIGQTQALTADERKALRALGVRLGLESVFLPALLKPKAQRLRALLWTVHRGLEPILPPPPGLVSIAAADVPEGFYAAVGYRLVGGRAMRIDILDRLAIELQRAARKGPVTLAPKLLALAGLGAENTAMVIIDLGYRRIERQDGLAFVPVRRGRNGDSVGKTSNANPAPARKAKRGGRKAADRNSDSPFAKLKELMPGP